MTENAHWAVCHTFSSRVHRVRPEIEKMNHGTFLPTYARVWGVDGKLCVRERVLMPGYLFFLTEPEGWGAVRNVDGVYHVLANNNKASRVTDKEMHLMVLEHATGIHNKIEFKAEPEPSKRPYGKRRRRPRHGKRFRERASVV